MSHHYIPFANSESDWPLINSLYPESAGCRITLQSLKKNGSGKRPNLNFWIDAEIDGLDSPTILAPDYKLNLAYKEYISQFEHWDLIADPDFQKKPDRQQVEVFVCQVLNDAYRASKDLRWLSVPQLPYTPGAERNLINKRLAECALRWKSASSSHRAVRLILPVIFAKQRGQTDGKTDRNKKVKLAVDCFEASGANGMWIVDSTLDDQEGVSNFENERFPGIIKFHEELNEKLPTDTVTVAGPYWGLNLLLWARRLVKCPAIGVGRSYRYFVAGGQPKLGKVRVALTPLRRLAVCSPDLKAWLEQTLQLLRKSDPVYGDFATLYRNSDALQVKDRARRQVAQFYREWLLRLEAVSADSRALTLYQDFSSAFVLGKKLKHPLPSEEDVRNPALVAKQFMVNCL